MDSSRDSQSDLWAMAPHEPRRFVPADADLQDAGQVRRLYERLLAREIAGGDDLEAWLRDRSELQAAVSQTRNILYIRMTCQTDDADRAAAYRHFVEQIDPAVRSLSDRLDRQYLAARERLPAPDGDDRLAVHDRDLRARVELFREENVPLKTKESLLCQEYNEITGAMTVQFRGQERTLQQMGKFLREPDRPLREAAWRATTERTLADAGRLEDLFDRMLAVRAEIAANADCGSFLEYQFRACNRFDYTPADCVAFHEAIEQAVMPLVRRIDASRRDRLALETLRPWDRVVDPDGKAPLKPFEATEHLVARTQEIFRRLDPALGEQFAALAADRLLDLDSRKGKAPGGYQATLEEARRPFIFANAVGLDRDVTTLVHEGGHAFHTLAAADQPLLAYRGAPTEFAEVASMGMEMLAWPHLEAFYDGDDLTRARRERLEGIVGLLPSVAIIDGYQHWLYADGRPPRDERREAWLAIHERFTSGLVDWSGLDEARACLWHRILHIFEVPLYYVEYGIAQLGALQLWTRFRDDPAAALRDYRKALALGGSRPLPELFAAAGLEFDFTPKTLVPLMELVADEWQALLPGCA